MALIKQRGINQTFGTAFSYFKGDHRQYLSEIGGRRVLSLDVSDFDMSWLRWQMHSAFDVLRSLIDMPSGHSQVWDRLVEYFTDTPVLNNRVVYSIGGILSGSAFTHLIGCTLNAILLEYLNQEPLDWYRVYGDDSIIVTDKPIRWFIDRAWDMGFTISPTKSRVGIDWLGYRLDSGVPRVIDVDKRFASLLNPESPDTTDSAFAGRIIGHLIASLGDARIANVLIKLLEANPVAVHPGLVPRDVHKFMLSMGVPDHVASWRETFNRLMLWVV